MNTPLIIGVHGLNRKPRPDTLRRWWVAALSEGLVRNLASPPALPMFQLCYWADLTHAATYTVQNDPEPYRADQGAGPMAAGRRGARSRLKALGLEAAGKMLDTLASAPFLEERLEDLLAAKANDLFRYHAEPEMRQRIRLRLGTRLRKAGRADRPVLLIAHSMGSIIAYDVLRAEPALKVDHLVTIGSPLGLGEVKNAARQEFGDPRIPDGVSRWTNLADPRDRIAALDLRLASDYAPGPLCVTIEDWAVSNGYVSPGGKPNPHKVYGYLRTPEMSAIIASWQETTRR